MKYSGKIDLYSIINIKIRMASLVEKQSKKEYISRSVSVFESPEDKNEDRNIIYTGTSRFIISDELSIELACVFDGHGGDEVSIFLKQNFAKIFINTVSSIISINGSISESKKDMIYRSIIDTGVIEVDDVLCKYLSNNKILMKGDRDPGSTLSMWVNFITSPYSDSYLVNLGDSPAFACNMEKKEIAVAYLHDIKNPISRKDASKNSDITFISDRYGNPITDISVITPEIIEMIPTRTMVYKDGYRFLNVPCCMGHVKWEDSINKHPSITKVPENSDIIILMTDGVSDMMIDHFEYVKLSMLHEWDINKIGELFRNRWYQPWKQLYNGKVYDNPTHVAIKGHSKHIADDMTIVHINLHGMGKPLCEQTTLKEVPSERDKFLYTFGNWIMETDYEHEFKEFMEQDETVEVVFQLFLDKVYNSEELTNTVKQVYEYWQSKR